MGLGQLGCQGAPHPEVPSVHWSAWRAVWPLHYPTSVPTPQAWAALGPHSPLERPPTERLTGRESAGFPQEPACCRYVHFVSHCSRQQEYKAEVH